MESAQQQQQEHHLKVVSNKMENLGNFKDPKTGKRIGTYGIHSDQQNNAYLLDFSAGNIVKIDATSHERREDFVMRAFYRRT